MRIVTWHDGTFARDFCFSFFAGVDWLRSGPRSRGMPWAITYVFVMGWRLGPDPVGAMQSPRPRWPARPRGIPDQSWRSGKWSVGNNWLDIWLGSDTDHRSHTSNYYPFSVWLTLCSIPKTRSVIRATRASREVRDACPTNCSMTLKVREVNVRMYGADAFILLRISMCARRLSIYCGGVVSCCMVTSPILFGEIRDVMNPVTSQTCYVTP